MDLEELLVELFSVLHNLALLVDSDQVVQPLRDLAEGGIILLFELELEQRVLYALSQQRE